MNIVGAPLDATTAASLRGTFQGTGRLVVDQAFTLELAERLFASAVALDEIRAIHGLPHSPWPWVLRFSLGRDEGTIRGRDAPIPRTVHKAIVHNRSRDPDGRHGIYYWFEYLRTCRSVEGLPSEYTFCHSQPSEHSASGGCSLCDFEHRLLAPQTRAWVAQATGISPDRLERVSCSLTRYDRTSFLSKHDDTGGELPYELAFIYYLNPTWLSEWGGELWFKYGERSWESILPHANRLVLFEPSKNSQHLVAQVNATARACRFAVSGWFLGSEGTSEKIA